MDRRRVASRAAAFTIRPLRFALVQSSAAWQDDAGNLTDVPVLRVGHFIDSCRPHRLHGPPDRGRRGGGIDVRGSAPDTPETALLRLSKLVEKVQAVLLSGGSVFGLDAATGVMRYLEKRRIGVDVGDTHVPIVLAAIIFDLGMGDGRIRSDAQAGYRACESATTDRSAEDNVGTGVRATIGRLFGCQAAP